MPEHAEIRITKDFINHLSSQITFSSVSFSKNAKGDRFKIPHDNFFITAQSRGKELKLIIRPTESSTRQNELQCPNHFVKVVFQFGMTGNWYFINEKEFKKLNHVHVWFEGIKDDEKFYLAYQDVRRFGNWKIKGWGGNRGPDPIFEFKKFVDNIKNNLHKKIFDGRLMEVLMDQKYFNGIGNYLRAEIIANAKINHLLPARDVLNDSFYNVIHKVISEAYDLGGAQLKDWKNPFAIEKDNFMKWLKAYKKGKKVLDKQKRNFWYLDNYEYPSK